MAEFEFFNQRYNLAVMMTPRVVADSRGRGDRLFIFTRLRPSRWRSARTTNAVERLHEEFKRRIKTPDRATVTETGH